MNKDKYRPIEISFVLPCIAILMLGCNSSTDENLHRQAAEQQSEEPAVAPSQLLSPTTNGTVTEVLRTAVKIENDGYPEGHIFAVSDDLKVYSGGTEVALDDVRPGDKIAVHTARRGNRADGYQTLAVQIDVIAGTETGRSDSDAETTASDFVTKLEGVVLRVENNTIEIHDPKLPEQAPSVLPVDPLAIVTKRGEKGGLSLLENGDRISMTAESQGNPQDGYIRVIKKISVSKAASHEK